MSSPYVALHIASFSTYILNFESPKLKIISQILKSNESYLTLWKHPNDPCNVLFVHFSSFNLQ